MIKTGESAYLEKSEDLMTMLMTRQIMNSNLKLNRVSTAFGDINNARKHDKLKLKFLDKEMNHFRTRTAICYQSTSSRKSLIKTGNASLPDLEINKRLLIQTQNVNREPKASHLQNYYEQMIKQVKISPLIAKGPLSYSKILTGFKKEDSKYIYPKKTVIAYIPSSKLCTKLSVGLSQKEIKYGDFFKAKDNAILRKEMSPVVNGEDFYHKTARKFKLNSNNYQTIKYLTSRKP